MSWGLETSLARYSVVRCGAEDYGCGLLRPPLVFNEVCEERNNSEHLLKRFKAVRQHMTKYSFLVPMFDKINENALLVTDPLEYLIPSILHRYMKSARSYS